VKDYPSRTGLYDFKIGHINDKYSWRTIRKGNKTYRYELYWSCDWLYSIIKTIRGD